MNTDHDEFDALRSLLTLKRHETPPPGYFNTLSGKICTRIEREEQLPVLSFFGRLFSDRIKPALGYSFVFSVCGLMAYAVNSFLHLEAQPAIASENPKTGQAMASLPSDDRQSASFTISGSDQASNSPALSPSLFMPLRVQPASLQFNGN